MSDTQVIERGEIRARYHTDELTLERFEYPMGGVGYGVYLHDGTGGSGDCIVAEYHGRGCLQKAMARFRRELAERQAIEDAAARDG